MTVSEVQVWDEARGAQTLTREQYIAEFGEEKWQESFGFKWPAGEDLPPMIEAERSLANRMQAEHRVNAAGARASVDWIFELPSEDDDETISLDDLVQCRPRHGAEATGRAGRRGPRPHARHARHRQVSAALDQGPLQLGAGAGRHSLAAALRDDPTKQAPEQGPDSDGERPPRRSVAELPGEPGRLCRHAPVRGAEGIVRQDGEGRTDPVGRHPGARTLWPDGVRRVRGRMRTVMPTMGLLLVLPGRCVNRPPQ